MKLQPPIRIKQSDALARLALDLSWSWNHSADQIWKQLDPELWEITANPWLILQAISPRRLAGVADDEFRARVQRLAADKDEENAAPAWFQTAHRGSALRAVAYFSMEYMLSEALPIYSGGLGNVAGDQLKAASDLGVPVVAVGLLYQQGYFRQELDARGEQRALYPVNEPGQLPISPVRTRDGRQLRIAAPFPGITLWIRAWEAQVGRRKLYLLDTNDPANPPNVRAITSELYGGDSELRLKQELVLGVFGWRLLRRLGMDPDVCHLNEGHAAFAVLERARAYMEVSGRPFPEALAVTRAGNVFTTHTAVDAGFDRFDPGLVRQYLAEYAEGQLGIAVGDLLALGRPESAGGSEPFNMAYLAIRGSGRVNGVSRLHGKVSRRLFQPLFPRLPEGEVPVGHVTNGVHVPTWDGREPDQLWTERCGRRPWRGDLAGFEERMLTAEDERIWRMRSSGRAALVQYARRRLRRQEAGYGGSALHLQRAEAVLDPHALTLGFARRFATYKRPALLLRDRDRLARILTDPRRPVQLILAGKAHPNDVAGQAQIREWTEFVRSEGIRARAVFLSDYDMLLAERLVEGVDVWINTPMRPWEASGTSGMKILVNGGLNLSVLDGWWAEAYSPEVGWAVGDGREHEEHSTWDRADADDLYRVLEHEVIPEFYDRDSKGIPRAWVARVRRSMARLTPLFSANRTVRQYVEEHYLPAAAAYCARTSASVDGFLDWQEQVDLHWDEVRFEAVRVTEDPEGLSFEVDVRLGCLPPAAVRVELYADAREDWPACGRPMRLVGASVAAQVHRFAVRVPAGRPAGDFTPRVRPHHEMALPVETSRVVWQK